MPRVRPAFLLVPLAVLLAGCGWFAPNAPTTGSLQVETVPPGATVTCNGGDPRVTPARFEGLPPGRYVLTARKDGFREARQAVLLESGQKLPLSLTLEPALGFVLLHSSPDGAEVTLDGASRGRTPLLIPDFPLGSHRLRFAMNGFEPKEIELTVKDRTPIKTSVDLASRTARLVITSDPVGATVYVNNAPRGATPCEIEVAVEGPAQIELKLEGHSPFSETLTLRAGNQYPVRARLAPLPADLEVVSAPANARVFVDGIYKGTTPILVSGLSRGTHKLTLELKGYETLERVITLAPAGKVREDAVLVRNSGTLVLITSPPGVEVFVDGEAAGTTMAAASGGDLSEPLRVDLLSRGEHTLQLTRRGYSFTPEKFVIEAGQVVQLQKALTRLFIRDTAVVIRKDFGRYEITGQLLRKLPDGSLELEVNPGILQKIEAGSILEIRAIKPEPPRNGP